MNKEFFKDMREQIEPDSHVMDSLRLKMFHAKQRPAKKLRRESRFMQFVPMTAAACLIIIAAIVIAPFILNDGDIFDPDPAGQTKELLEAMTIDEFIEAATRGENVRFTKERSPFELKTVYEYDGEKFIVTEEVLRSDNPAIQTLVKEYKYLISFYFMGQKISEDDNFYYEYELVKDYSLTNTLKLTSEHDNSKLAADIDLYVLKQVIITDYGYIPALLSPTVLAGKQIQEAQTVDAFIEKVSKGEPARYTVIEYGIINFEYDGKTFTITEDFRNVPEMSAVHTDVYVSEYKYLVWVYHFETDHFGRQQLVRHYGFVNNIEINWEPSLEQSLEDRFYVIKRLVIEDDYLPSEDKFIYGTILNPVEPHGVMEREPFNGFSPYEFVEADSGWFMRGWLIEFGDINEHPLEALLAYGVNNLNMPHYDLTEEAKERLFGDNAINLGSWVWWFDPKGIESHLRQYLNDDFRIASYNYESFASDVPVAGWTLLWDDVEKMIVMHTGIFGGGSVRQTFILDSWEAGGVTWEDGGDGLLYQVYAAIYTNTNDYGGVYYDSFEELWDDYWNPQTFLQPIVSYYVYTFKVNRFGYWNLLSKGTASMPNNIPVNPDYVELPDNDCYLCYQTAIYPQRGGYDPLGATIGAWSDQAERIEEFISVLMNCHMVRAVKVYNTISDYNNGTEIFEGPMRDNMAAFVEYDEDANMSFMIRYRG